MIPKPLAVLIVCGIAAVWTVANIMSFVVAGFTVDGWIHSIFLVIVGGALGFSGGDKPEGGGEGEATGPIPAPPPPPPQLPPPPRKGGSHRAFSLPPIWRAAT